MFIVADALGNTVDTLDDIMGDAVEDIVGDTVDDILRDVLVDRRDEVTV